MRGEIRPATVEDIPALVTLGAEFFAAHPFAAFSAFDADSLTATLTALCAQETACVLVAVRAGAIVGTIVGATTPLFFNQDMHVAYEIAWFMAETERRGALALQLFDAFERWAEAQQVQAIMMTAILPLASLAIPRLYARHGYQQYERNYIKGV